ncbi:pentatricopeptide repeat-containing protein At5g55740, chloroplastic-like isoform X2 [Amaranthus tricolor]|uniref:pentatricopeptide repeat-containing protein At5g55740, chloroplastic-like isoform X2 n=1 Tax=Amaranthus tricolor TaxID=29722 RepID=UPI002586A7B1|nr:pentatricopeptide repeat-containing protein At5g55740, chloroplastic-like isoform X2 [Amaranthus tricolor]
MTHEAHDHHFIFKSSVFLHCMAYLTTISPTSNLLNPLNFKPRNSLITPKLNPTHVSEKQQDKKSCFLELSSLSRNGRLKEAVNLLSQMHYNCVQIGPEFYVELLQGCVCDQSYFLGQQIHGLIIKKGEIFIKNEYIETKLVIFYAKCDELDSARRLFTRLCIKNVFSWAAIIGLNSRIGLNEQALFGYCEMLENGIFPDNFVIPNALKACGASQCIVFGRGIHGFMIKVGFEECMYVASSLVDMYGKCGILEDAKKVFDEMSVKNSVVWNSMIVGYVQNGMNEEAIQLFYDMMFEEIEPTRVTMSSLLSASANLGAAEEGRQGHALAVLYGLELDSILGSSLINFYSKIGWVEDAELIFTRMVEKDAVTWNLLISCYVQQGLPETAINMCRVMTSKGLRFDCVTMASFFSACAYTGDTELGKQGHCYCIRNLLDSDVAVASSLISMYSKFKETGYAVRVFDSSLEKDLVLWNALLAACAERGLGGKALELFYQMQLQGFRPNLISWNSLLCALLRSHQVNEAKSLAQNGLAVDAILHFQKMQESGLQPNTRTITGLLSACIDMTSLLLGKSIHGYVIRQGHQFSVELSTSLVDMYAKCGNITHARKIFNMMSDKSLALYNAMISGYGLHSKVSDALALYEYMQEEGLEPDDVTFTSILSACSHGGLVNKGFDLFADMVSKYNISPRMEHYGCLVTLLSRCGNLDEAIMVIMSTPLEPDAEMLGSLLIACREWNQIELAEYISTYLLELEPNNSGNYVTLSNISASAGRWAEASEWRNLMKSRGLNKKPGCSWVQIGSESHVFVSSDRSHPQRDEINMILALLETEMRSNILSFNLEICFS